jgi:hypothetical protein
LVLCKINCSSIMTPKNLWAIKHESVMLIFFKIKSINSSVVVYIWWCKSLFYVTSVENKYRKIFVLYFGVILGLFLFFFFLFVLPVYTLMVDCHFCFIKKCLLSCHCDALSPLFFNFALEYSIRKVQQK